MPLNSQVHSQFYPYTTPLISTLSYDASTDTHISFNATPNYTHTTWARTHSSKPELYLQPSSLPELRLIVNLARQLNKKLTLTGSSHSPNTITQTKSWLINLDNFSKVVSASPISDEQGGGLRITVEAGIRLWQLLRELDGMGYTMPNLGSITEQSVAGAIATSTHGSSLRHGLLSESVEELELMLTSGRLVKCSMEHNVDLFRAALVSLGALGVVTHVTFRAVPQFNVAWTQRVSTMDNFLRDFQTADWTKHEFARCWWFPYTKKAILWNGDKTDLPLKPRPKSWYAGGFSRWSYEFLLWVGTFWPKLVPSVERWVFKMQYGSTEGKVVEDAVEKSYEALSMDCLFSQLVNEWSIPLHHGPEAIRRLTAWLSGDAHTARIPFPSTGVYVHAPIEVRVSDSTHSSQNPFLDQSITTGPSLYLNATLYRPFLKNVPKWEVYYQAFEYLMKEYGGKPHWAKNWVSVSREEVWGMYPELGKWVKVRGCVDPEGVFVGGWLKDTVLGEGREEEERREVKEADVHVELD